MLVDLVSCYFEQDCGKTVGSIHIFRIHVCTVPAEFYHPISRPISFSVLNDMDSSLQQIDSGQSSILSKRLNKILETRLENDKDTLEALKELSTFFTENTLQARRNLRSKIEKRSLVINEDFLSAFRGVKEALDGVYKDVTAMNNSVQSMMTRLQTTKNQTHNLIDQTTKLQTDNQKLTMQKEVIGAFLSSFQLSQKEIEILRGSTRDAAITSEFFVVLERLQNIHSHCRLLMQSGHQTGALDIMEEMALFQETALERLYRWTQSHCRNIESADKSLLLTQAMCRLQDRPVLFKYVLDEYCTSRRSLLVRAFIDALTVGGHGGTPRPIELHAHDPKRYLGDMLAWLHQTVPSEKENLLILLKGCDKTDVTEQIMLALSQISDGVCHPLKVRVEHILSADTDVIVLYSITNLIRFYQNVIGQVVPGSSLETLLVELEELSKNRFLSALQSHARQLINDRNDSPPSDLSPSPGVSQRLNLLREVLSVEGVAEGRHKDLDKIVACVIDPLLRAVNEGASRLPTTDMAVYLLNCIYQMQSMLSLYEFMDERLERLQAQSEAQLDTLTSEQASSLVANLNLGPIYTILQEQDKGALSSVPGMDPISLKMFLEKLDSFLVMPDMLLLPQIGLLLSSAHRATTQRRGLEVIAAIYRQLYDAVHSPANKYLNPAALMPRTPDEVLQLLVA